MEKNVILLESRPSSGKLVLFQVFTDSIHEIQQCNSKVEPFGTWFIDDTIRSGGTFLLSTKFDPLFLLLPILKDCASERFVPLQQAEDPDGVLDHIMPLVEKTAPKIAETSDKMSPRFLLVKYSQSKTEAWLKRRIQRTADVLATMQGSGTSTSSFSLRSESTSGSTTAGGGGGGSTEEVAPKASHADIMQAIDIVSDCLNESWDLELCRIMDKTEADLKAHRAVRRAQPSAEEETGAGKWNKLAAAEAETGGDTMESGKRKRAEPKAKAKGKAIAPIAGQRSLMGFFKRTKK